MIKLGVRYTCYYLQFVPSVNHFNKRSGIEISRFREKLYRQFPLLLRYSSRFSQFREIIKRKVLVSSILSPLIRKLQRFTARHIILWRKGCNGGDFPTFFKLGGRIRLEQVRTKLAKNFED